MEILKKCIKLNTFSLDLPNINTLHVFKTREQTSCIPEDEPHTVQTQIRKIPAWSLAHFTSTTNDGGADYKLFLKEILCAEFADGASWWRESTGKMLLDNETLN